MTKQKIPAMNFSETKSKKDCDVILQEQAITTPSLLQKASQDLVVKVAKKQDKIKYDQSTVDKAISIYNSRFSDPSKVTYALVSNLGSEQYKVLKQNQENFSSTVNAVQNAGVFFILEKLSNNLREANLEGLYRDAVNVKPTMVARFLSAIGFGGKYKQISVNKQYDIHFSNLKSRSEGVVSVVKDLEKDLLHKKSELLTSLTYIRKGFTDQFQQLKLLASEHLVARMALERQEEYVEHLSSLDSHNTEVQQTLVEAKRVLNTLVNRELILRGSIASVPLKADEYDQLLTATQTVVEEIDNTLDAKFLSLYGSLNTIAVAMKSAQGLNEQQSIEELANNLSNISNIAVKDIATKSITLSANNRLREVEQLEKQLENIRLTHEAVDQLNKDKKQILLEASDRLNVLVNNIQTQVIDKSFEDSSKIVQF